MPKATKPGRIVMYNEELHPQSQNVFWSRGFTRSRQKLNMLYLDYHGDNGYQTWQGGSMQWRASFNEVTKSLDHVILQGRVAS